MPASATKTLNLRVDANLKAQAERIFSELGLPTSTAITMFLKAVVRHEGLPFEANLHFGNTHTSDDPFWSETNQKHLAASIHELEAGHGREHELIDA